MNWTIKLIEALVEYGFTQTQAEIAANNESFNYDEECVEYINNNYIGKTITQTLDEIKAALADEGFTNSNIEYAIEETNLKSYLQ